MWGGELWSPLGFLFNDYWGALCPGEVASVLSHALASYHKFKAALCNVSSWPARGSLLMKVSLPLTIQQCPAKGNFILALLSVVFML